MVVKQRVPKEAVKNPETVAKVLRSLLEAESVVDQDKEHFWTIGVNTKNMVKYVELVALGTIDSALVHPREVFRLAVIEAAASLILAHNHPSGDTCPSDEDIKITQRLVEAGRILGIEVLDHVVVGGEGDFYSFKSCGCL